MQPLRQRPCFEADPRGSAGLVPEPGDQRLRLACHLRLADHLPGRVHHANARLFQRHVDPNILIHGRPSMMHRQRPKPTPLNTPSLAGTAARTQHRRCRRPVSPSAMVVAQLQAGGDVWAECAEAGAHTLAQRLERLETRRAAGSVDAQARGRGVIDGDEDRGLAPVRVAVRSVPHPWTAPALQALSSTFRIAGPSPELGRPGGEVVDVAGQIGTGK